MTRDRSSLIAAAIVALGIIIGGYLLGDGLTRARMADRSVTVRGLAERDVTADLATWTIAYTEQGTQLGAVQSAIDEDTRAITAFFQKAGFKEGEVSAAGVGVSQYYDSNRGVDSVTVRRQLRLRTNDVMKARAAYTRQSELLRDGVELSGSNVTYTFTKLNDLKPGMIAEATRNARRSADQFARDSETSVGRLKTASQGYFSVGARDGDACEDCSSSGGSSPFQKVRVVTTIDYDLG